MDEKSVRTVLSLAYNSTFDRAFCFIYDCIEKKIKRRR